MNNEGFRKFVQRIWIIVGGVSVRTKIFGIVLGSTLLLSFVFAVQVQNQLHQVLDTKIQEQGVSIARDVAAEATDLILINDYFSLHQLLDKTNNIYPDVRYAFVIDPRGDVLAHTFGDGFPLDLVDVNSAGIGVYQNTIVLETNEGVIWDVAVPIFDGTAGTARVGISELGVHQTLVSLTTQLVVIILVVLAVSLIAAITLTWVLTKPILTLVEATKRITLGDFSMRVHRWANDEIGDLAMAFNQMTEELGRLDVVRQEREHLSRKLLEGVITAQEEERRRIARELHDSTSQSLTSLKVNLTTLENECECLAASSLYQNISKILDQTLHEVHTLAVQLRPAALDDLGLIAALERYLREWQIQHKIATDFASYIGDQRLPEDVETAVYRIVQESLTNVVRHAEAQSVSVLVERRNDMVIAIIEDDGKGFVHSSSIIGSRLGLLGIQERTELLGGSLTIETAPDIGTSIFIKIPLDARKKVIL
jgi:signal transduction histidine kinase